MFSKGRVKNLSCAGERAAEVERAVREHERNQPGGRSVFDLFGIQQGNIRLNLSSTSSLV